jgi:hypothetical protein
MGAGLLPEKVGGHDGVAICEKPSTGAPLGKAAAKSLEVAVLTFVRLLRYIQESCF